LRSGNGSRHAGAACADDEDIGIENLNGELGGWAHRFCVHPRIDRKKAGDRFDIFCAFYLANPENGSIRWRVIGLRLASPFPEQLQYRGDVLRVREGNALKGLRMLFLRT
jgi:hypothetical protein